jgi:GNAT superfamily N-acetyltransferase
MTTEASGAGSGRELPDQEAPSIRLGPRTLRKFGFAAFHRPGEPMLRQGVWHRPVCLRAGDARGDARIAIPEKYLQPLPAEAPGRLSDLPAFSIVSTGRRLSSLALLSARAGWNQTPADLRRFFGGRQGQAFTAALRTGSGAIDLGSGSVFAISARLAWIGMILVHEEVRRQGIARAMMLHCLVAAESGLGVPLTGLDATPAGRDLYAALGFREAYPIWRCRIGTGDTAGTAEKAAPEAAGRRKIRAYLEKTHWLHHLPSPEILLNLPGSYACSRSENGQVRGFALSRPGRRMPYVGPVLADSAARAAALIADHLRHWRTLGFESVFVDIPEAHCGVSGADGSIPPYFSTLERLRPLLRMYRAAPWASLRMEDILGEERRLRLPVLYGIAGPEIG